MLGEVLFELALLFALCVAVAITFHRLRLPPVVAFLATGAVVGPHSLGLVHREDVVRELAELGIVILLFTVGLEVSVAQLVRLRRAVLVGGSLQIAGTILVGAGSAMALGLPWNQAVFLGLLLSLSSTAVVSKILGDHGEFNAPHGRISLGICLAQDLAVVPMIVCVPLLASAGTAGGEGAPVLWTTVKSLGVLLVATLVIRWLLPLVLDLVARTRSRELFVLTVATLCLSMAMITQQLGMSLALGAFLAGVLLADSEYHHQAVAEMGPFRDALSALFFVSIGMLFDPGVIAAAPGVALIALLAVLLGKGVVVMAVARRLGLPFWFRLRTALTLAQVGEFSFLLVQVGSNLLPPSLEKVFLMASVLSIAATPPLYALGLALVHRARAVPDQGRVPAAAKALRDHAVIVGFGPTGQAVGRALQASAIPFMAVEMNAATVKAFRDRGVRILLGDCTRDVVLRAAGLETARVLIVAINDADAASRTFQVARRLAPNVHVIARATYLAEVPLLQKTGAHEVVAQELETSVEIMVRVLRRFLVPDDEVVRQVKLARDAAAGAEKLAGTAPADVARIAEFVPGLTMQFFRVASDAEVCGRSLLDAAIRRRTGCAVVAVRRQNENLSAITPETVLEADDVAVVIGPEARMAEAAAMFHPLAVPARPGATDGRAS